ncbi:MAG: hypothetical protein JSW03_06470 [Candidatus Eiseniibacteriota bacterium]|nr:MAG: hypothetical protein JSW03_06470 [Candidatus Eisenbacteria bacterium]
MGARASLVMAAVILALVAGGCYTVLKHPEGVTLMDESYQRKSCMDCHQEAWFYHYDPYWYGTYYPNDWWGYYGRPWWYDDYWYYYGTGEYEPVERGRRHMWTVPSLRPPDNLGIQPGFKPPAPGSGEDTSKKKAPAKEPEDSKKEESKKKKRHMWTK